MCTPRTPAASARAAWRLSRLATATSTGCNCWPTSRKSNTAARSPCSATMPRNWGRAWRFCGVLWSLDLEQFDLEDERRVGRDDAAGAAFAIAEVGWDDELAGAAFLHAGDAFVPALDDDPLADGELERNLAIAARIELFAVQKRADVVDDHDIAGPDFLAGPRLDV